MKIILGSESKWRKSIFESMGYEFSVMPAYIDEKAIRFDDPKKLVSALAKAKANSLLPKINEQAALFTFDQVIVCDGNILEKPENKEQAREYLRGYKDNPAESFTCVCVTDTKTKKQIFEVDVAGVIFNEIPENVIEWFIEQGDIFTCAGGFTIANPVMNKYIKKVNGTEDSVQGFPIKLVRRLIKEIQIQVRI